MIDKKDFNKLAKEIVSQLNLRHICRPRITSPSSQTRDAELPASVTVGCIEKVLNSFDKKQSVKEYDFSKGDQKVLHYPPMELTSLEEDSVRQLHLEDETPEQTKQLDKEFKELDLSSLFSEMDLVINYIRKNAGLNDFFHLGKCNPDELTQSIKNVLPTLSEKSVGEIVKELQARKDRPELWPRENNDDLLVPQMNKLISFLSVIAWVSG